MTGESNPIVIMDSGVGGLPYLETARKLLDKETFVYLADRAGFPYGTKSGDEVRRIVLDRIARLVERFSPKAVVIACNTASQAALSAVRAANPDLAFIGTVPAIKPAAGRTKTGVIGVIATAQAVRDPYLDELIARFAPGLLVHREPAQELVAFVERRFFDSTPEARREAVAGHVRRLVDAGADQIVLACTHFLYLRDDIAAVAGPGVGIVDSRGGIAQQLSVVLSERALLRSAAGPDGRGLFLLSGGEPAEASYSRFAEKYDLLGPELLPLS
ncbi:MAG TPA: glutamate racemase [Rectinemataceae bacterium]|nr:glutamate racemase [Rectinemataceae bacterium]